MDLSCVLVSNPSSDGGTVKLLVCVNLKTGPQLMRECRILHFTLTTSTALYKRPAKVSRPADVLWSSSAGLVEQRQER